MLLHVLFFLLFGVGFDSNLTMFWVCLSWVSWTFVYFIRALEPSKTRSSKLFIYPWSNCVKPNRQVNMVPFSHVASLVFVLYSRRLFKSMKGFCSPQKVYGKQLIFSLGRVFMCFICAPFLPFMGRFFNQLSLSMFNFRENQWVQSCCQSSLAHDTNYSFKRHHC